MAYGEEPNTDTRLGILSDEDASSSTSKPRPVWRSRWRRNDTSLVGIGRERTVCAVDQRRRLNRALLCAARLGVEWHLVHRNLIDTFESINLSARRPVRSLRPPRLYMINIRTFTESNIVNQLPAILNSQMEHGCKKYQQTFTMSWTRLASYQRPKRFPLRICPQYWFAQCYACHWTEQLWCCPLSWWHA